MAPPGDIRPLRGDSGVGSESGDAPELSAGNGTKSVARDVQYLVLTDLQQPYLLARLRWPDVFQAISPMRPDWQDDPGLFDLPYSPSSTPLTMEQAAMLAAEWGSHIPADDGYEAPRRALMRRMPADWSNLSRAERRAWSIDDVRRPKLAPVDTPTVEHPEEDALSSDGKRRWHRRAKAAAPSPELAAVATAHDDSGARHNGNGNGSGSGSGNGSSNGHRSEIGSDVIDLHDGVIDLTEAQAGIGWAAEDA